MLLLLEYKEFIIYTGRVSEENIGQNENWFQTAVAYRLAQLYLVKPPALYAQIQ